MSDEENVRELWRAASEEAPSVSARDRALAAALSAADDAPRSSVRGPERASVVARASRARIAIAAAAVVALAAAIAVVVTRAPKPGNVTASARTEIDIGGRARAVLEPTAHVAWKSPDDVEQSAGSVFYRVERGGPFRVHTPAGDVAVLGTCFRVTLRKDDMNLRDLKSGSIGAAVSLAAIVVVYEGKVAVSHAGQSVELAAGETARASTAGVKKAEAEDRLGQASTTDDPIADPTLMANQNLVASVSDYRARMEKIEIERRALEQQLADARARLEAIDAGAKPPKLEVTEDEWKELAKEGSVKMRVPCNWKGGWYPSPQQLNALGLSPADASAVQAASNHVYERSWALIKPVCERLGGKEIAERLGLDGCPNFIFSYERGVDREAAFESMRRVSEMRAGLRPMLALDDPSLTPVERVFLVNTGMQKMMETDLAQTFGPDEAHRLVTSESFCGWSANYTGTPRKASNWGEKTKFE